MTNHSEINLFLSSISEAKRALDAEPSYQRRIDELERDLHASRETIAKRELHIHSMKQDQESLTQKLRSVEAERDDAGFRALEEADKVSAMLTLVRGFIGDATRCVASVEGVAPPIQMTEQQYRENEQCLMNNASILRNLEEQLHERDAALASLRDSFAQAQEQLSRPLPQPEALPSPSEPTGSSIGETSSWPGERVVDPTAATATIGSEAAASALPVSSTTSASMPKEEAKAEDPFASPAQPEQASASSPSVIHLEDAASGASQKERNRDPLTQYKDRKYYDVPVFVPLHEWLNKGGTEADYYWRPDRSNTY